MVLEQDAVVVGEGGDDRLRHVFAVGGEPDAQRRPAARGLHHQREAEPLLDLLERVRRAELGEAVCENETQSGVSTPASRSSCLAAALSIERRQALTPGPV